MPERRGRRQLDEGQNVRCEICWTIVRANGLASHQQNSELCKQWRAYNVELSGSPSFNESKYAQRHEADKQFQAQKNFHCKYCHRSFGKQWDLWQHCSFKHVDSYEAKQHYKSTKGASALPSREAAAVVLTAGPGSGSGSGGRYRERERREDPPKRNKEKKEKKEKKKGKKKSRSRSASRSRGRTSPHPLAPPPPQPQEPQQPQKEGQLGWLEEEVSQGGRRRRSASRSTAAEQAARSSGSGVPPQPQGGQGEDREKIREELFKQFLETSNKILKR